MSLICPRCQADVADAPECSACGVVVSKFRSRRESGGRAVPPAQPSAVAGRVAVSDGGRVRLGLRLQAGLYSHLGRLLDSGLTPIEALRSCAAVLGSRPARGLNAAADALSAGCSLSEALLHSPGLFPPHTAGLLEAAERTGALPAALQALAAGAEMRLELRRQLVRTSIYPFVLFSLVFFVPKAYLVLTAGWGAYLLASGVPYLGALAVLAGLFFGLPAALRLLAGPDTTARLVRAVPIVGGLLRLADGARFCDQLAVALGAGLDMLASLRLAARATGSPRWRDRIGHAERALQSGASLFEALGATGLLEAEGMLAVDAGERAGRLVESLSSHARLQRATLGHRLNAVTQLAAVALLLATYFFVARALVADYRGVMDGTGEQMQQLMKELGGSGGGQLDTLLKRPTTDPAMLQELPEDIRKLLK